MGFNEEMPEEVAEHLDAVNKMAAMQRVDAILREKFARFSIEGLRKGVEVDALVTVGGVHFYCRVKCPLMKPRFEPLEELGRVNRQFDLLCHFEPYAGGY